MPAAADEAAPAQSRKRSRLRRALAAAGLAIAVVLAALFVTARFGVLAPQARTLIETKVEGLKIGSFGRLHIEGLTGDVWRDFRLARLTLSDDQGVWLDARNLRMRWRYGELLIRRFHAAAAAGAGEVLIWGSGSPRREFMHVDDLAAACVFVMNLDAAVYGANTRPMLSHINVGTGTDCTIRELAETLAQITGFTGRLHFDTTKPDGSPRKLMDVSRLTALGWQATIGLEAGLQQTYDWFRGHVAEVRA